MTAEIKEPISYMQKISWAVDRLSQEKLRSRFC